MSTFGFAFLTKFRAQKPALEIASDEQLGVSKYVDAMAALVPAEVLAIHAIAQNLTTSTEVAESGAKQIIIDDAATLGVTFWVLIGVSIVLYVLGRGKIARDYYDWLRAAVPPTAFIIWTMLQKGTAFDAVAPEYLLDAPRAVAGVIAAVLLGAFTAWLAQQANNSES